MDRVLELTPRARVCVSGGGGRSGRAGRHTAVPYSTSFPEMSEEREILERVDVSFDGGIIKEVYFKGEEGKVPSAGDEVQGA